jgi:hypothetical protein
VKVARDMGGIETAEYQGSPAACHRSDVRCSSYAVTLVL